MKTKFASIAFLFSTLACTAQAQWQWIDEAGRKVFSDRQPPAHIPQKNILKSPSHSPAAGLPLPPAAVTPDIAPSAPAQPAAAGSHLSAEDQALAEKQRQDEEAQQKAQEAALKAEAARVAAQRQDNCRRARSAISTLNSGLPMTHINDKGERGFMSAQQRQQEVQRAQAIIRSDCGPMPGS